MPHLVNYSRVLETATAAGLRCVYPNGAAFSLRTDPPYVACWAEARKADPTIRPAFADRVRQVAPGTLGRLCVQAWEQRFPAAPEVWLAPAHHWAAELVHHGSDVLRALLVEFGLDADALSRRTQADALAFDDGERDHLPAAVERLFDHLSATDFTLIVPGEPVVATLHHHRQVWWQCGTTTTADRLLAMVERGDS